MTLLKLLETRRRDPALIQDDSPVNREELLSEISLLRLKLQSSRRVMVASSEAVTVAAAMTTCQSLNVPLWIGHEFSSPAALDDIARSQQIDVRIGNGREVTTLDHAPATSASDNFAVHIMTSGTTGTPKIARHSLDALMGRVNVGHIFSGAWLLTYPPSTFAGVQVLLTAAASNSTLIAYRSPSVPVLAGAMSQHGVTHASGTPTFWRAALMALAPNSDVSRLQQITIGGEMVDQGLLDRLVERFPKTRITHIYASTEAGALFSVKDQRAGFPADWLDRNMDGVEMRIRDGLLEVRSPRSMRLYASGHASPYTEDGWLKTGDRVQVNGQRVYFGGRADHIINIGGAKVVPEEVEKVVLGVKGVVDVCVSGAKNPLTGFVLKAEVVSEPGIDKDLLRKSIAQHCHSMLPPHMVPRIFVMVEQLRASAAGKKSGGVA
jgi:acyl-coenzyme A synthetase/AMP-(fatty) acid ligase